MRFLTCLRQIRNDNAGAITLGKIGLAEHLVGYLFYLGDCFRSLGLLQPHVDSVGASLLQLLDFTGSKELSRSPQNRDFD